MCCAGEKETWGGPLPTKTTAARSWKDSSASSAKKIIRPLEKKIRPQIEKNKNFLEMDLIRVEIALYGNHITDGYLSNLLK
jgi:hypothetical protein